jgi:hypothetical protein
VQRIHVVCNFGYCTRRIRIWKRKSVFDGVKTVLTITVMDLSVMRDHVRSVGLYSTNLRSVGWCRVE